MPYTMPLASLIAGMPLGTLTVVLAQIEAHVQ
jgi:hypothetical protein